MKEINTVQNLYLLAKILIFPLKYTIFLFDGLPNTKSLHNGEYIATIFGGNIITNSQNLNHTSRSNVVSVFLTIFDYGDYDYYDYYYHDYTDYYETKMKKPRKPRKLKKLRKQKKMKKLSKSEKVILNIK